GDEVRATASVTTSAATATATDCTTRVFLRSSKRGDRCTIAYATAAGRLNHGGNTAPRTKAPRACDLTLRLAVPSTGIAARQKRRGGGRRATALAESGNRDFNHRHGSHRLCRLQELHRLANDGQRAK